MLTRVDSVSIKVPAVSGSAITCSSAGVGHIIFDTDDNKLKYCDGTNWVVMKGGVQFITQVAGGAFLVSSTLHTSNMGVTVYSTYVPTGGEQTIRSETFTVNYDAIVFGYFSGWILATSVGIRVDGVQLDYTEYISNASSFDELSPSLFQIGGATLVSPGTHTIEWFIGNPWGFSEVAVYSGRMYYLVYELT